MFLKKAATLVFLSSLAFIGCTDEQEQPIEEPVAVDPAPPAPDLSANAVTDSYTPSTIYFAFDDYTLNAEAESELSRFADYLNSNPGVQVQVEGHCDERGTIEYNLALGERRAQAVKNYLSNLGVDGTRIMTISYGEERNVAEGHDEDAWSRNRRAEFIINAN